MRCKYSENDIALYVEGDLATTTAREIQTHLTACTACRELAASLGESQAILKTLRQDAVSAAALSSVRARILAEIGGPQSRWSRWPWDRWIYAVAGAAFVVLIGVMLLRYSSTPEEAPQVQQVVELPPLPPAAAVPVITETPTMPAAGVRPRQGNGVRRRQGAAQTSLTERAPVPVVKPLVVKLLTDDPNIVIYWFMDQENGGAL